MFFRLAPTLHIQNVAALSRMLLKSGGAINSHTGAGHPVVQPDIVDSFMLATLAARDGARLVVWPRHALNTDTEK